MIKQESYPLSELRALRLSRHWSQEQLSEMTGLSTRTIQRIEGGNSGDFETLKALSAVFEVNFYATQKNQEKDVSGSGRFVRILLFVSGTVGCSLTLLGLLFRAMYWKGASIMLVLGVALMALVFVPVMAYTTAKRFSASHRVTN